MKTLPRGKHASLFSPNVNEEGKTFPRIDNRRLKMFWINLESDRRFISIGEFECQLQQGILNGEVSLYH